MKKMCNVILNEVGKNSAIGIGWLFFVAITLSAIATALVIFLTWLAFTYPVVLDFYAMVPIALVGLLIYKTYKKL